jgi:hypothetical protein
MPSTTKTWADKMQAKPPHTVILAQAFAGVPAGARLLIASPQTIDAYLRQHLPPGTTQAMQQMRRNLAREADADDTCPVSTAIFLRTVAEHAWDQLEAGASLHNVAPFWRVVDPGSPLAKKLRPGSAWIEQQRAAEVD